MVKDTVADIVRAAVQAAIDAGDLSKEAADVRVEVGPPKNPEHGEFATAIALAAAKPLKRKPRDIADAIAKHIAPGVGDAMGGDLVERVDIAGPGFLNITLTRAFWHQQLAHIIGSAESFGQSNSGKGVKVLVEFVSANPTGPLHIGHARNAAVGDTVATLYEWTGHDVQREFYVNDIGAQINNLGRSVWLRYSASEFPANDPDLYYGDYVESLAAAFREEYGDKYVEESEEALQACRDFATPRLREEQVEVLRSFRVEFARWFGEHELHADGDDSIVWKTIRELEANGDAGPAEGATWFRSSKYGDTQDHVLVRSDGRTTYFAADLAYHRGKLERGFDLLVNVWGADHHGYLPRMRGGLQALGYDPEALQIVFQQMVRLFRGTTEIKMSKRAGEYVTLAELIEEIGADATRFALLMRSSDSQMDFDIEEVKRRAFDNPVYYVQYGHARVCSMFRMAEERGVPRTGSDAESLADLTGATELRLIREAARFPEVVLDAATRREPHRVVFYLQDLVKEFHGYYGEKKENGQLMYPVVDPDEPKRSAARLALVDAIRTVLANGLAICGVNAPQQMERDSDA